jgi:hypothetical protein
VSAQQAADDGWAAMAVSTMSDTSAADSGGSALRCCGGCDVEGVHGQLDDTQVVAERQRSGA